MDTVNDIEDQPKPPVDEKINAAFQQAVNELGQQLVRKFTLSGNQFNALELELRVYILIEQVNLLTKILQQRAIASSDDNLTEQMTLQVTLLAKTISDALAQAPRIAVPTGGAPPPSRMNGSRHN